MSLALNPILPVKVTDPVLDFESKGYYAVVKGGIRTSWKPIISTSYSNSSATFSAPPPNPNIAVNRHVKLVQPVTINFSGNAPDGQALLQSQNDAPRAYPLSSNISTIEMSLNNTNFSINMADTIQALLRYHNPDKVKDGDMSRTPSTLDKSQQYSDLVNTIHNPLASIIDTGLGGLDPRGAFPADSLTNNISTGIGNTTTAVATYTFTEDIFLSPLTFGTCAHDNGFIGLQTFQMTINWKSDLRRIWCHDDSSGTTLTNITVTLGQPTLLFQYKTPDPLQMVPMHRTYPYYEVQRYPTDLGTAVTSQSQVIMSSSNIQLNSIPRHIYVFARKRDQDLTYTDTDTFFSIERISINWANQSGLLSSATKQDLYEMSRRHGCNLNWRDWSGESSFYSSGGSVESVNGVGSVLCIEFGTDIALAPDEAPGLNGTYQLQMEVTVTNRSDDDIIPALYVAVVNEGIFTLENNTAWSQIGVISRTDVLNCREIGGLSYMDLHTMAGAAFFKNLGRKLRHTVKLIKQKAPGTIRKAIKTGKKAYKLGKEVYPIAKQIFDIMQKSGVGYEEAKMMAEQQGSSYFRDLGNQTGGCYDCPYMY